MQSYEALKEAVDRVGVKSLAGDMNLSTSLIYKWCEPTSGPDACGADNPLDRVVRICELTGDSGPVEWLCTQLNGFLVRNASQGRHGKIPLLKATQSILKEFSDVMQAVSESYANGDRIDAGEAQRIRKEWEELKSVAESFVVACECGDYNE